MFEQDLSTHERPPVVVRDRPALTGKTARQEPVGVAPSIADLAPQRGLQAIVVIAVLYLAAAAIMASLIGVRFTFPQSGEIPGLHANIWLPPIVAALAYIALQVATKLLRLQTRSWIEVSRNAATDYFLLCVFIAVIYVHFNVKMWIPLVNPSLHDEAYFAVDQALQPMLHVFALLRAAIAGVLPWADIWYQAAFFAIFVLSFLSHALGDRRFHLHNIAALMLVEMIGVFAYFIAPALGPFVYETGPNALATAGQLQMHAVYEQVRQGGAAWVNAYGGASFGLPLAAMPSLHVACTLVIVYYAFRARLRMAPITVLAFGWIFIESAVSRWHYVVDLPVGLLLAVAVIALVNRHFGGGARIRESKSVAAERSTTGEPLVWVLKCHRDGDHAQSLALAEALGWPFQVKQMVFHWYELLFVLAGWTTLAGLNRRLSSAFEGPWPDVIILAGRMNEVPAKWVRKQSGGRTKIVEVGRSWCPIPELDCLVTTPQFRLPKYNHVLVNNFPLHRATPQRLAEEARRWAPSLADLPGPYVTLLVGGSSGPYVFSRRTAQRLGREASAFARARGATLLVSTSLRTGRGPMRALADSIDVPCRFYKFRPKDPDNPHLGFLALADWVIVTGDSLSMLTEACAAKRSVHIFEFGGGSASMHGPRSMDPRTWQWWRWRYLRDQGLTGLHYAWAIGLPPFRLNRSRDIRRVQDQFISTGLARWLGSNAIPVPATLAVPEDLQRAAHRVRSLVLIGQGEARPSQVVSLPGSGTQAGLPA